MVKRVKDMTIGVSPVEAGVDTKRVLRDVEGIDTLVSIDTEDHRDSRTHGVIVPEKCPICEMGISRDDIKYYDIAFLKKFMSVRGKIIPRSKSGVCSAHQRSLKQGIKRARYLALLPYVDIGI